LITMSVLLVVDQLVCQQPSG